MKTIVLLGDWTSDHSRMRVILSLWVSSLNQAIQSYQSELLMFDAPCFCNKLGGQ